MISVLIATKDRPQKLKACIRSILLNTYHNFEILILDQSRGGAAKQFVNSLHNKRVIYTKLRVVGKSKAINRGLTIAKGDIISFTDDDCIVSRNWLSSIDRYFKKHPKVMGVFGKTLPYEPKKHHLFVCPATFTKFSETITSNPKDIYSLVLGQGNNVSYRQKIFQNLGNMNESFGPGARILTGEDCEFLYRALIKNYTIAYSPKILVYHNRWITTIQERELQIKYTLGTCASAAHNYIKSRDKRALFLLAYKIHENVISKIKINLSFYRRGMFYVLRQTMAIVYGVYLGLTAP